MALGGFRVGIVGAGGKSLTSPLCAWRNIAGVTIAGIADSDQAPARAREVAEAFGIPFSTGSVEALLDRELDAVHFCASSQAVDAALNRCLPVFCAKAPASTSAELRRIGELADRNGALLMTAQPHRYGTQAQRFRRWIAEDRNIGQAYHARACTVRRPLPAGAPDIAPHALDLCLWLLGFPRPLRVTGATREHLAKGWRGDHEWERTRFNVEDFMAGFVHFEKGLTLVFESAAGLDHPAALEASSCEIFGVQGNIQWPSGNYATVRSGSYIHGQLENAQSLDSLDATEIRAFYDAVTRQLPSPVPWQESEKIMMIIEAIKTSQREGREVLL